MADTSILSGSVEYFDAADAGMEPGWYHSTDEVNWFGPFTHRQEAVDDFTKRAEAALEKALRQQLGLE